MSDEQHERAVYVGRVMATDDDVRNARATAAACIRERGVWRMIAALCLGFTVGAVIFCAWMVRVTSGARDDYETARANVIESAELREHAAQAELCRRVGRFARSLDDGRVHEVDELPACWRVRSGWTAVPSPTGELWRGPRPFRRQERR